MSYAQRRAAQDPAYKLLTEIENAIFKNDFEKFAQVIQDTTPIKGDKWVQLIYKAASTNVEMLVLLLNDKRFVSSECDEDHLFTRAASYGPLDITKELLKDKRFNPANKRAVVDAYLKSRQDVVQVFLLDSRITSHQINELLKAALSKGDVPFTTKLTNDPRFTPDQSVLQTAIEKGNLEVITKMPTVDPSNFYHLASGAIFQQLAKGKNLSAEQLNNLFKKAITNNNVNLVEHLLKDPLVDPTTSNHFGIKYANSEEMIRVLLRDSRVDPSVDDNYAHRNATTIPIKYLLQQDPRVKNSLDPSKLVHGDYYCFRHGYSGGCDFYCYK